MCSVKKMFLKILQNLEKNTFARISFLKKLQTSGVFYKFCEIFRKTFPQRTPPVAASR